MLLRHATAIQLDPPSIQSVDLRIESGLIIERARSLSAHRGEELHDLHGSMILPGMICAHTHLYSSLSRGMPAPRRAPHGFLDILKKIWWKLDCALDEETTYYSALVGAIDAVKHGTTTLIDHHAAPNAITGSLDIIKKALNEVGLRGVLCYETTDRGGKRRRDAGLRENERFVEKQARDTHVRGMIGAHASFTLSDETMERLGELARVHGCGVHIHVAEDKSDVQKTKGGIIKRLQRFGALGPKSILAHGVHLTSAECAAVSTSGAWLVHNPRSNMNNAVGYAPIHRYGKNVALGTDGFPADMFEECKLGYFRNRESRHPVPFARLPEMLSGGQTLISSIFGQPFGTLRPGSPADLTILEYLPPTPLTKENLLGHFLFGMHARMVTAVMVGGRWIMQNRRLLTVDEELITKRSLQAAKRLWKALESSRS